MQKYRIENVRQIVDEGQTTSFINFYTQFFKNLIIESDKYVKDVDVAEEIVQDVFFKIWEKCAELDKIKSIKAYLYRCVVNASINHINKQKTIAAHHQKIAEEITLHDIERLDEENDLIVALYAEIDKLPTKCKEVFKLNRLERLKYKEIAAKLNISERTVENHIANALKVLKTNLLTDKSKAFCMDDVRVLKILFLF